MEWSPGYITIWKKKKEQNGEKYYSLLKEEEEVLIDVYNHSNK